MSISHQCLAEVLLMGSRPIEPPQSEDDAIPLIGFDPHCKGTPQQLKLMMAAMWMVGAGMVSDTATASPSASFLEALVNEETVLEVPDAIQSVALDVSIPPEVPMPATKTPSKITRLMDGQIDSQMGNQADTLTEGVSFYPKSLPIKEFHKFPSGVYNAITDVPGMKVAQVTLIRDDVASPVQTGVTAIVPDIEKLTRGKSNSQGNLATHGLVAYGDTISGFGEMTGLYSVRALGVMNSPVILTNTRTVGVGYSGVCEYYHKHYPGLWRGGLPVVGECWDGRYNDNHIVALKESDVVEAIERAHEGPVLQGRIGAGRGMQTFDLHGGIGTASRQFKVGNKTYTLGVLVNSNHGDLDKMPEHIYQALENEIGDLKAHSHQAKADEREPEGQEEGGSIIIVIATDLPMSSDQLALLVPRATAGLAAIGSKLSITSGDFVLAMSTAKPVPMGREAAPIDVQTRLSWDHLNTVFEATVEAVAEAQLNALVASYSTASP